MELMIALGALALSVLAGLWGSFRWGRERGRFEATTEAAATIQAQQAKIDRSDRAGRAKAKAAEADARTEERKALVDRPSLDEARALEAEANAAAIEAQIEGRRRR